MGEVLKTMRDSYDSVVIDSPPVTTMADAAVLSGLCDGVILVVHGQRTPVGLARQAMERLAVVQARILGVVLNGVDIRNPEYAYYQSYNSYVDSLPEGNAQDNNEQLNGNGVDPRNGRPQASVKQPVTMSPQTELTEIEPLNRDLGSGDVPLEFFEHMIFNLCKAVGPMAARLLDEKIDQLGESRESFPRERLKELLEQLCQEILNDSFKAEFLKSVRAELETIAT
jgi:hypothetical protein